MIIWIIPVVIIVGVLIWMISIYNKLVRNKNMVQEGWSGIEVQLKRRSNLIPNLIEAVKGYMGHEAKLLSEITQLRSQSKNTQAIAEKSKVETALTRSLGNLIAVAESYPDLKANQNFLALQEELTSTENKISSSRQFYNDSVLRYNNQTQMFPSNVVSSVTGFKASEFFEVPVAEERKAPKVSFT